MQIKTAMRYHLTPYTTEWLSLKGIHIRKTKTKTGYSGWGEKEYLYTVDGNVN